MFNTKEAEKTYTLMHVSGISDSLRFNLISTFNNIFDTAVIFCNIQHNKNKQQIKLCFPKGIHKILNICIQIPDLDNLLLIKKIALNKYNKNSKSHKITRFYEILKNIQVWENESNLNQELLVINESLHSDFSNRSQILVARNKFLSSTNSFKNIDLMMRWASCVNYTALVQLLMENAPISDHIIEECLLKTIYPVQAAIINLFLEYSNLQDSTIKTMLIKIIQAGNLGFFQFVADHIRLKTFTWGFELFVIALVKKDLLFLKILLEGSRILPPLLISSDYMLPGFYESLLVENTDIFELIFNDKRLRINIDFSIYYLILRQEKYKTILFNVLENGVCTSFYKPNHAIFKKTIQLIVKQNYIPLFFENRALLTEEESFVLACQYGVITIVRNFILHERVGRGLILNGMQLALDALQIDIILLFLDEDIFYDSKVRYEPSFRVNLTQLVKSDKVIVLERILNNFRIEVNTYIDMKTNLSAYNPYCLSLLIAHENTPKKIQEQVMIALAEQNDFMRLSLILMEMKHSIDYPMMNRIIRILAFDIQYLNSVTLNLEILLLLILDKRAPVDLVQKVMNYMVTYVNPNLLGKLLQTYNATHLMQFTNLSITDNWSFRFFSITEQMVMDESKLQYKNDSMTRSD